MIAVNMMIPPAAELAPDDPPERAVELFAGGADVLPVTGPGGELLGAVTPASLLGETSGAAGSGGFGGVPVATAMGGGIPAVAPSAPAEVVMERFREGASAVFVTDDCNRLLGVITPAALYGRLWKYEQEKG